MIGSAASYGGTFDGNGHTLNVTINSTESFAAPFRYVTGTTTIKNLHVTGAVKGGIHSTGLVGGAVNSPTITFDNVWVSVSVVSTSSHLAGFLGHTSDAGSNLVMTNCRFDGSLQSLQQTGDHYGGAFVGWGGGTWSQKNLYENSTANNIQHFGMNYKNGSAWSGYEICLSAHDWGELTAESKNTSDQNYVITRMNASQPGAWILNQGLAVPSKSCTVAETDSGSASDILTALGNSWKEEGNAIVPVTISINYIPRETTKPTLPDFYHIGTGKISPELIVQTRQSSVVLTWTVEGIVDYYQVLRRPLGSGDDKWEIIADHIDHLGYEDKSVSPLEKYEYKVMAISDCEGLHTSETVVKEGFCKNSGRLSGYVRLKDGTGVGGIEV